MHAQVRIFLKKSVILRKILSIFVNTDLVICEQKVRNFLNNKKRLHFFTEYTVDNLVCKTVFWMSICNQLLHKNHQNNYLSLVKHALFPSLI